MRVGSRILSAAMSVFLAIGLCPGIALATNGASLSPAAVEKQNIFGISAYLERMPTNPGDSWETIWEAEASGVIWQLDGYRENTISGNLPDGISYYSGYYGDYTDYFISPSLTLDGFNDDTMRIGLHGVSGQRGTVTDDDVFVIHVWGTNTLSCIYAQNCRVRIVGSGTLNLACSGGANGIEVVDGSSNVLPKLEVDSSVTLNVADGSNSGKSILATSKTSGTSQAAANELLSINGAFDPSKVKSSDTVDRLIGPDRLFAASASKTSMRVYECDESTYYLNDGTYAVDDSGNKYFIYGSFDADGVVDGTTPTNTAELVAVPVDLIPDGYSSPEGGNVKEYYVASKVYKDSPRTYRGEKRLSLFYAKKDGKTYAAAKTASSIGGGHESWDCYELNLADSEIYDGRAILVHGIEPVVVTGSLEAAGFEVVSRSSNSYNAYIAGSFTNQDKGWIATPNQPSIGPRESSGTGFTDEELVIARPIEQTGDKNENQNNQNATDQTNQVSTGEDQSVSSGSTGIVEGQTVASGGISYKVTSTGSSASVAFAKAPKSKKSVKVPATVKIDGKAYKVTSVAAGAFKGAKATKVTLGKNVKKVAKGAFKGSKVKTVTVKSKKLTKKSVKGCFKGSKVKTVKAPKSKLKAYGKAFAKANCGKKVEVVAV